MELAIAVIIGGAFGQIITSFVGDVVMPLINPLVPGGNWREAIIPIPPGSDAGINIGAFLGAIVDFVIIALVLFVMIRAIERSKRQAEVEAAEAAPPDATLQAQERLTTAIERLTQVMESQGPS